MGDRGEPLTLETIWGIVVVTLVGLALMAFAGWLVWDWASPDGRVGTTSPVPMPTTTAPWWEMEHGCRQYLGEPVLVNGVQYYVCDGRLSLVAECIRCW